MAKKSNKTEHVMKLITKERGETDAGGEAEAAPGSESVVARIAPEVRTAVASEQELNYKTKLKIEIEPEIEIKGGNDEGEPDGGTGEGGERPALRVRADAGGSRPARPPAPKMRFGDRNASGDAPPAEREKPDGMPFEAENAPFGASFDGGFGAAPAGGEAPAVFGSGARAEGSEGAPFGSGSDAGDSEAVGYGGEPEPRPVVMRDFGDTEPDAPGVAGTGLGYAESAFEGVSPGFALGDASIYDYEQVRQNEERRMRKIMIESDLVTKEINLINLSEILTKSLLPSVMEKMDVCTCPICTANVLALTLNSLQPKYVTTGEGKQYTQLEVYKGQYELDVMSALTRACAKVKQMPRHEIHDTLKG